MSIVLDPVPAPTPVFRVATQDPSLTLSGLDLMMEDPDPTDGYRIHALADNFTWGDPEAVIASIVSQLQDGDLERIDRDGNREATVPLAIDAPGSSLPGDSIARGQAALDMACTFTGWTELVWVSPLAGSEATVFEVTSATVSAAFDDAKEMLQGTRYVTLTIHARPWVRGTTPVTIEALAVTGATTETVDDGSSTTGWSMLSTAPAPVKNLETNPDFKTNVTGYSAGSGTSSITHGASGTRTYADVFINQSMAPGNLSYVNGPLMPVTAGLTYQIGSVVSTDSSWDVPGSLVRFYSDAAGTKQIGSDHRLTNQGGGNAVTRAWTITAPAGSVRMRVYRFAVKSAVTSTEWVLDKQWTSPLGPSLDGINYFDGSTADTAALTYTWDGTVNNSTSTATWSAPSLAIAGGRLRGMAYGRKDVEVRRTNTGIDADAMGALPYLRVKGTATPGSSIDLGDDGDYGAVTAISYTMDSAGNWEALVYRPSGFTTLDIKATKPGAPSTTTGLAVGVVSIELTDSPFGSAKTQSRQVQIYGSQRTELSLSILGLDVNGTTPVGLGEQVLVHTAAAGTDGRAKFLNVRTTGTTVDATAVSGYADPLPTIAAPTSMGFPAAALLPGNYLACARLRHTAAVSNATVSFRAQINAAGQNVYDPRTGWKTIPLTVLATGAAWPQLNVNTWGIIPLGLLRLPPADVQDPDATINIQIACTAPVDLDDIFLCNADVGQASLLLTDTGGGTSFSAAELNAATVDAPQPSGWVGVANGAMIADAARWIGEQHQAAPGLLQIGTVTPGCATSRVSAQYYPRNHTNVMRVDIPGAAG